MNKKRADELIETLEGCIGYQNIDINAAFHQLQQLGKNIVDTENFKEIFEFLNAIGNEERLKLIQIIKDKDYCVCELEIILDKSQPSISHHLKILEKAGLIRGWRKGKFTHYSLMKEQVKKYLELLNKNFKLE